jgi:hypothetical protein
MTTKNHKDDFIIVSWIIFLTCITLVASYSISARISDYRAASDNNETSQINSINPEDIPFHTDVFFGTYLNKISRLSIKESNFDS